MCPVCGKKVGSWHPGGVHPKCKGKERKPRQVLIGPNTVYPPPPFVNKDQRNGHDEWARAIQNISQPARDAILRRISGPPRTR